jgi:hypothetical protein
MSPLPLSRGESRRVRVRVELRQMPQLNQHPPVRLRADASCLVFALVVRLGSPKLLAT